MNYSESNICLSPLLSFTHTLEYQGFTYMNIHWGVGVIYPKIQFFSHRPPDLQMFLKTSLQKWVHLHRPESWKLFLHLFDWTTLWTIKLFFIDAVHTELPYFLYIPFHTYDPPVTNKKILLFPVTLWKFPGSVGRKNNFFYRKNLM